MGELPSGTVTLLFTDIEGSTRLLEGLGRERYAEALARHREILRRAFAERNGYEVDYEGDAFFVSFASAADAVGAAIAAQRGLAAEPWPEGCAFRVRMGIHTGEPLAVPPKYVGLDVHRAARIMAAGHGGQTLLSERTAGLVEDELPADMALRDLGEHRLKDLSRPRRLYQLVIEGLPSEFPPLRTLGNRATNLPVQPNRLIGRTEELAVITGLLRRREARLLTLTGPGGTGKTRVALQAAAELVDEFADGVFVVFLASLRDPGLLLNAIAQTLGLRERAGQTLEDTLPAYLNEREMLLVLDNFEHLLDAAPVVSKLLAGAPSLALLVTSRESLRIAAECLFEVPSLSTPDSAHSTAAAAALAHDAVALFVERATAAEADFELTGDNVGAVAEICARLDGLPLAIELAAARTRALSPEALVRRLDQRLALLTGGARDADERQRTLRATIEWSHDLLTNPERTLFARLAVFVGGCRSEVVEAVCNPGGELGIDVIDGLASLVDKSVLRQRDDSDGEPRFWMLETIREYARERLLESGEEEEVARRHATFFLDLVERANPELQAHDASVWLARLDAEHDNLRTALDRALADGQGESALRLTGAIWEFWFIRGYWSEARRQLEASVESAASVPPELMVDPLWGSSIIALLQGDSDRAAVYATRLLSLSERQGINRGIAIASELLAMLADDAGDLLEASRLYRRAKSLAREIGDGFLLSSVLNNLGDMLLRQRDFGRAALHFEESLEIARRRGDSQLVAGGLANLGYVALGLGEPMRARSLFRESLEAARAVGYRQGFFITLLGLGVTLAEEDPLKASRLLGSADAALEDVGASSYLGFEEELHMRTVEILRSSLGEDRWATAYAQGRALSFEHALSEALSVGSLVPDGGERTDDDVRGLSGAQPAPHP